MSEVIGIKYPVRTAALETHENDGSFFSSRNFPGSLPDLPEDGDLGLAHVNHVFGVFSSYRKTAKLVPCVF